MVGVWHDWNHKKKIRIIKKVNTKVENIKKEARNKGHLNLLKSPYHLDLNNTFYAEIPLERFENRWYRFQDWLEGLIRDRKLSDGNYFIQGRPLKEGKGSAIYCVPVYAFDVRNGHLFNKDKKRTFPKRKYKPHNYGHHKRKYAKTYAIYKQFKA